MHALMPGGVAWSMPFSTAPHALVAPAQSPAATAASAVATSGSTMRALSAAVISEVARRNGAQVST